MTNTLYLQNTEEFIQNEVNPIKKEVDDFLEKASHPNMKHISEIANDAYKNNKIPKIIHFCYINYKELGNCYYPLIYSWIKNLSDYEFINWTPEILPTNNWCEQAIKNKKWAFYADYARIYGVYNIGGFYMDCDVVSYKSFDDLLDLPFIFDLEYSSLIDPDFIMRLEAGCFGGRAKLKFMKLIKEFYENKNVELTPDNYLNFIAPVTWGNILTNNNYRFFWMQTLDIIKEYYKIGYSKNDINIPILDGSYFSRTNTKIINNFNIAHKIGIEEIRIHDHAYTSHQMFSEWIDKK